MPAPPLAELARHVSALHAHAAAGYDTARERVIWNKRLDKARAPDAVVECRSAKEVAAAVRFAAANGLKVSPRGTGHHYEAAALREGGLLLDLGGIDFIEIDEAAGTARVGAAVVGGPLSERLARQGLAFPVGHCVDVGLSGYVLAGGFGWNAGEWGAACTNVTAVEMVTAAGEIVVASETDHPDLFWAARGAGPGFFAAITAYHLRLNPLPPATFAWRASFAVKDVPAIADWLSTATEATHPTAEVGCFLLNHWDTHETAAVIRVSCCAQSEEEARERISPFFALPTTALSLDEAKGEPVAFTELFKMSPMPSGKRVAADHAWSDATLGELLLAIHDLPSPSTHSTVDLVGFGGHSRVALPTDAALSLGGGTGAGIYALWDDPADDEANRTWVRRIDEALAPFRSGRYVGEADLTAGPDRLAECFTPQALERLRKLRASHDPNGLFFAWP